MTERSWKIGKVQIILGHSSKMLKVVVSVLLIFFTAAMVALGWVNSNMKQQTELKRADAAEVAYENEVLQHKIDNLGSIQSVEQIAQEELGMISPDTILIEAQVK